MEKATERARELLNFDGPRIVTVGLIAGNEILTGKRRDNGLWTSPGGHMDEGETLFEAAKREVKEESGIEIEDRDLELVTAEKVNSHRTGKDFVVFGFLAKVEKERATAKNDPDKEISEWKWVPLSMDSKELLPENRHAKKDSILEHLGLRPEPKLIGLLGGKKLMAKTLGQMSITERRMAMESNENTEGVGGKKPQAEVQQGDKELPPNKEGGETPNPAEGAAQPGKEEQEPVVPEPKEKTPEEMALDPKVYLEEGTGAIKPNSSEHMPKVNQEKPAEPVGASEEPQKSYAGPTEGQAEKPRS